MKKNIQILMKTELFSGIKENDLENMLQCLGATEKKYDKNEIIVNAGTILSSVGILISGNVQITREDLEGNRAILSEVSVGDLFGEAYVAARQRELPITVVAVSDCSVVWIPFRKIIVQCACVCTFHTVLIANMLRVIAEKNILMNEKMRLLSCKTTREKLYTYLVDYSEQAGSKKFVIPFNRGELADFLSVDRSAMSRELGKLKEEGLINFNRNEFELI
ncbi:Crp/Fnr family transcriptional regulator [Anaerovorax odorimutans]|uniref:Crp/Fnr family transcriptional regulator n=1 Tax=Anaerovorax odorimutans TaxID=109327 RepID=UPI0004031E75|nr:Crp/Fnr family transcriptional regulator [Anaerovorax odorimutans]